jgi:hypothetical protein
MNVGEIPRGEASLNEKKLAAEMAKQAALKNIKEQMSAFVDTDENSDKCEDITKKTCPICQESMDELTGYPIMISFGPVLSKNEEKKYRFLSCMHEVHIKCFMQDKSKKCSIDRLPCSTILPKIPNKPFDKPENNEELKNSVSKMIEKYGAYNLVNGFFNEIFALELRHRTNPICITKNKIDTITAIFNLVKYMFNNNIVQKESVIKHLTPIFVIFLPLVTGEKTSDEVLKENFEIQENKLLFCRYLALMKQIIGESIWEKQDEFDEFDINEAITTERLSKLFKVDLKGQVVEPYHFPKTLHENILDFAKELDYSFSRNPIYPLVCDTKRGAVPCILFSPSEFSAVFIKHNGYFIEAVQIYVNKFGDPDKGAVIGLPLHLDKEKVNHLIDFFLAAEYLYY